MKNSECQTDKIKIKDKDDNLKDDHSKYSENSMESIKCKKAFHGIESIRNSKQAYLDLCGISVEAFDLLLKIYSRGEKDLIRRLYDENKLLFFLIKMKINLIRYIF